MKCPRYYLNDDDNSFSEWKKECKECTYFKECLLSFYELEIDKDKTEEEQETLKRLRAEAETLDFGDNFPYVSLHKKQQVNKNRKEMVVKLLNEDNPKITINDIVDMMLDLELYNRKCLENEPKKRKRKKK